MALRSARPVHDSLLAWSCSFLDYRPLDFSCNLVLILLSFFLTSPSISIVQLLPTLSRLARRSRSQVSWNSSSFIILGMNLIPIFLTPEYLSRHSAGEEVMAVPRRPYSRSGLPMDKERQVLRNGIVDNMAGDTFVSIPRAAKSVATIYSKIQTFSSRALALPRSNIAIILATLGP